MSNRPYLHLACVNGRKAVPELALHDNGLRCGTRCPHHIPRPANQGGVMCRLDGLPLVYQDGYVARCAGQPADSDPVLPDEPLAS